MNKLASRRHQANCQILAKLQQLIDKYPDQRFVQLLENFGIVDATKDLFYEESDVTLNKLEAYMK